MQSWPHRSLTPSLRCLSRPLRVLLLRLLGGAGHQALAPFHDNPGLGGIRAGLREVNVAIAKARVRLFLPIRDLLQAVVKPAIRRILLLQLLVIALRRVELVALQIRDRPVALGCVVSLSRDVRRATSSTRR